MKDIIFDIDSLLVETKLRRMKKYLFETNNTDQTDIITANNNSTVLLPQFTKLHIAAHSKPGTGSVFAADDFITVIKNAVKELDITSSTRIYPVDVPGVGYDLVKPFDEAKELPDAEQVEVEKQEGQNKVLVPGFKTSKPLSDFETNDLTIVISKADRARLSEDILSNEDVQAALAKERLYVILSAWPGGEVPKASEWNGEYAVIIPSDQQATSKNETKLNSSNDILVERWQKMAGLL